VRWRLKTVVVKDDLEGEIEVKIIHGLIKIFLP
jgi:hypothetical protein